MFKICFFLGLTPFVLHAQSADFQFYGKSIPEIRQSLKTPAFFFQNNAVPVYSNLNAFETCDAKTDVPPVSYTSGISKWKPEDLPFFCRIEHQMGKKLPVQFKFRLGSVEYVDWLEGKR